MGRYEYCLGLKMIPWYKSGELLYLLALLGIRTFSCMWANIGVNGFGLPLGLFLLVYVVFVGVLGWGDINLFGLWVDVISSVWLFPSLVGGWSWNWGFLFSLVLALLFLLIFSFFGIPCAVYFVGLFVFLAVSASLLFYIFYLLFFKKIKVKSWLNYFYHKLLCGLD